MTATAAKGIKTVLHPVSDLAAATAVYTALFGVPPQIEGTYYVGFEIDGHHIGLVPDGGPQAITTPVNYWEVPDIEAKLAELIAMRRDGEAGPARCRPGPPSRRGHRPRRQYPRPTPRSLNDRTTGA